MALHIRRSITNSPKLANSTNQQAGEINRHRNLYSAFERHKIKDKVHELPHYLKTSEVLQKPEELTGIILQPL